MFRTAIIYLVITVKAIPLFSQDKDVQTLYNQATKSLKLFVIKNLLTMLNMI